jgi:hypothetical protein
MDPLAIARERQDRPTAARPVSPRGRPRADTVGELCAAMGRNGRAYIRDNYRWDLIMGKYERMMAKVKGR